MYEQIKTWYIAFADWCNNHYRLCIVLIALAWGLIGYLCGYYRGYKVGSSLYDDGGRTDRIAEQLERSASEQHGITDGLRESAGQSGEIADRIADYADEAAGIAKQAAGITESERRARETLERCQRILSAIRSRGKTYPAKAKGSKE